MKEKEENMINLAKELRKSGYLLPVEENEVEDFESKLENTGDKPVDWDNPLNILKRGKVEKVDLKNPEIEGATSEHLSMVARDGKGISAEVRKQMDEDREKSRN